MPPYEGQMLTISGQVRSYNKVVDGAGRLMVTLFAQNIAEAQENDTLNRVTLTGALCKAPIYRSTPFGREICDMMLAVNRAFGKSDYIPCIAWGRNAQYAARFGVGDRISLTGRLQSREYQKLLESGEYMTRNAYEGLGVYAGGRGRGSAGRGVRRGAPGASSQRDDAQLKGKVEARRSRRASERRQSPQTQKLSRSNQIGRKFRFFGLRAFAAHGQSVSASGGRRNFSGALRFFMPSSPAPRGAFR